MLELGRRPAFQGLQLYSSDAQRRLDTHGLYIYAGPTGSGKTLLAVCHSFPYADRRCNLCEPDCEKSWKVYANLESTKEWTNSIEAASQLIASEGELDHAIVILDEAYLNAESRRSMRNENLQLDYFLRQTRKKTIKLFFTTQTVDILDRRIRGSAKRVYNVWNPDGKGLSVGAMVYRREDGRVPPWKRRSRPQIRWWYTAAYRDRYRTDEVISEEGALSREQYVYARVPVGGKLVMRRLSYRRVVELVLEDMVVAGGARLTPTLNEISQEVQRRFTGIALKLAVLSKHLQDIGYRAQFDGEDNRYLLGVDIDLDAPSEGLSAQ